MKTEKEIRVRISEIENSTIYKSSPHPQLDCDLVAHKRELIRELWTLRWVLGDVK